MKRFTSIAVALALAACGDSASDSPLGGASGNNTTPTNNATNGDGDVPAPPPDVERFVVREVATTDAYVFVPNADPSASTVARVDANTLTVTPLRVGQNPKDVAATDVDGVGAVAYVLCEGNSTAAIIRADQPSRTGTGDGDVRLVKVPGEVNRLTMSPDGKYVIAWIDPERSLESSPIASLQVMALIKLGATPQEDAVYNLSVTRLIRDIEFTNNGELLILGREGINRLRLADVTSDRLVPKLELGLDGDIFPTDTFEMEVDEDGRFLVVRSAAAEQVVLYELPADVTEDPVPHVVDLNGLSNDVDLIAGTEPKIIVTVPQAKQLVVIDALQAISDDNYVPQVKNLDVGLGLAQLTPNGEAVVLYSTLAGNYEVETVGLNDDNQSVLTLRAGIYALVVSPDSKRIIAIHRGGAFKDDTATDVFRSYNGLTLIDLATGYLRPVVLQGEASDFVMTTTSAGVVLYVLLKTSAQGGALSRGVMRINLDTFRSDFVALPKEPNQIGRVGDKIFVSQEAHDGRLTFFDVNTNEQRTVSGYELNAVID